jgi:hypothetical protein
MARKKKSTKAKSGSKTTSFNLVINVTVAKDGEVSLSAGPVSPIPPEDPGAGDGSSAKSSKKKKKTAAKTKGKGSGTKARMTGGPTSPIPPEDPGAGDGG